MAAALSTVAKNKRKKQKATQAGRGKLPDVPAAPSAPTAPKPLSSSPFAQALGEMKQQLGEQKTRQTKPVAAPVAKPAKVSSSPAVSEDDRDAWHMAMQGVQRLGEKRTGRVSQRAPRVLPDPEQGVNKAEQGARARLDALVAQEVRFRIERDEGFVAAVRADGDRRVLRELGRLSGGGATLDLHGLTAAQARDQIGRFVRDQHRHGVRTLCIVHGKGLNSEGGLSVLTDVTIEALTESGAAPLVQAFVTAPVRAGGSGAMLVRLVR